MLQLEVLINFDVDQVGRLNKFNNKIKSTGMMKIILNIDG